MSGGFFRGTSADQDTRFSNKQAKLLKTHKFPPELDQPVDMSKVKMDVIRPWIATRVTELLGFEDEVLINFVYGLLDAKEVDGKQIQIQLTGFMEKNTGKFMKELWSLLVSAQTNVSGVPQQFLDAKEEEVTKRKAENDRITQEIQKRREKEGRELEQERHERMDGEGNNVGEEKEPDLKNDSREKNRHSRDTGSDDQLPLHRHSPFPSRSRSSSFSKSGSYSKDCRSSRSLSVSPQARRHTPSKQHSHTVSRRSLSPERHYRSQRHSISPRKHSPKNTRSPVRRRSPYSTSRRSPLISRHQSRSPSRRSSYGRRSPMSLHRTSPSSPRRSPAHVTRGSPYPERRRSPTRRRSPSPSWRRRSPPPVRRRSPPPVRRRSPPPVQQRSPPPIRRRSPPPVRRRSPSPIRRRSPSPVRRRPHPVRRQSRSPVRQQSLSPLKRSPVPRSLTIRRSPLHSPGSDAVNTRAYPSKSSTAAPFKSRSPYRSRRSLSRETDRRTNGINSGQDDYLSQRSRERRSPADHTKDGRIAEHSGMMRKPSDAISHRLPVALSSTPSDPREKKDIHSKEKHLSLEGSPTKSESPSLTRQLSTDNRSHNVHQSPGKHAPRRLPHYESPEASREEEEASNSRKNKDFAGGLQQKVSPHGLADDFIRASKGQSDKAGFKRQIEKQSGKDVQKNRAHRPSHSSEETEYGPRRMMGETRPHDDAHDWQESTKNLGRDACYAGASEVGARKESYLKVDEDSESEHETGSFRKSKKSIDESGSDSDHSMEKKRRKHSEKHRRHLDDLSEPHSESPDKEAKRRRKEEKRLLRKEEKRQRREKRHRRKLERRASKQKLKSVDTVTPPSDFEKDHPGGGVVKKGQGLSDAEEIESEQKKLEFELREKALKLLRAKKASYH